MSYNLRLIKPVIYRLKRSLGVKVRLVQVGDATENFQTGVVTPVYTVHNIDRVIKMPASMLRTFTTSFKNMSGGAIDFSQSVFIIDVNDLPSSVDIDVNDYIEYGNKHWSILTVLLSDDRELWILQVEALASKRPSPLTAILQGIGFTQELAFETIQAI